MKTIKTYKIFEIKKEYPFGKLYRLVTWFMNQYKHVAEKEGWQIYACGYQSATRFWDSSEVFIIASINLNPNTDPFFLSYEKEKISAEKYGWIINENGIIYDFDKEKFDKNKHLLIGHDLGLL